MKLAMKDGRKVTIVRNEPSEEQKTALAETLAKAITGGDYYGYM